MKGTLNVLNAALKGNVGRVLVASSSWVSGAQEGEIVNERSPFNLEDINTVYGASKISQELLCFSFQSEYRGPQYTVLRYGIPYGERMWKGLVVRAFMEMAERTGIISIMGDGKQFREFLYVGDLVEGHLHALLPKAENKVYNLTGRRPVTIEEIAKEVIKHFPAKIDYIPQARVEPKIKRVHNWLAENELGWVPGPRWPTASPVAPSGGRPSATSRKTRNIGAEKDPLIEALLHFIVPVYNGKTRPGPECRAAGRLSGRPFPQTLRDRSLR